MNTLTMYQAYFAAGKPRTIQFTEFKAEEFQKKFTILGGVSPVVGSTRHFHVSEKEKLHVGESKAEALSFLLKEEAGHVRFLESQIAEYQQRLTYRQERTQLAQETYEALSS